MGTPLRVLIVEDSADDTDLMAHELQHNGYDVRFQRVDTRESFSAALASQTWDVIIADYSLPRFGGLDALVMWKENGLDVPFIIVSGVIGEDMAVAAVKSGAYDYVIKDNLERLGPAVQRALQEAEERLARRQAEEALVKAEQEKELILDSLLELVIYQDTQMRVLWANQAACESVGLKREELVGCYCYEIWHQRGEPCPGCPVVQTRETGQPQQGEAITPDGRTWLIRGYPTRDVDGNITGLVETALETTEHTQTEGAYGALVEHSLQGLLIAQEDRIVFLNPAASEILGYSGEELLSRSLEELFALIHPDDRDAARQHWQDRVEGRPAPSRYEVRLIRKDGAACWIEIYVRFVKYRGKPAVQVVFLDITGRRRMEEALKLRVEQLAALSQASQAVTASLELDQVLAKIVSLTSEVTAADYTSVMLMDETGNIGRSTENLPGVPALAYRIRDNGLTSWIVGSRQVVVVDEIGEDGVIDRYLGEGAPRYANPFLVEAGIKSLAGLPLIFKDRLLGVLYLHSKRPDSFYGQSFLLNAFANQVAIAVENARLFQAEQQQARRLALLADTARTAATTLDANALLQAVAESIHRHFAYPMVGLFTLDDEGQTLILRGYSGTAVAPPEVVAPGVYRLSVEQGIAGHVVRTGKSYLAPDVRTDPYFFSPGEIPIESALCVPILDEGRVVGTMGVESDRPADFDQGDQSLLEAVADTVAIGLRNARLYQETHRRVQELTLLNRVSVGSGAALNLDALINSALEGLHELIQTDRTYFITADPDLRSWEITHERVAPGAKPGIGLNGTFDDVPAELRALLADQPFAVSDIATDPRVEDAREMYRSLGIRSILLVPVQVGGRLRGALGFDYCRERHAWLPDEIRLLGGVAHQLELALENVHLFEEVRLRAEELAVTLVRLEEMDHLKDQFIQNVSHELRSPLALIRGYAEMLDTGELGALQPEQQKPVAVIARRARMLGDLVHDITLILEAEANPPKPEPVALDELAHAAVEDFQVVAGQAGLTLHAQIAPHLPQVSGSSTYLRRVLDNLLGNAVKFTPAGGTVTVRLRQAEEQIAMEVSDTGVGIPPDQLERIFERFYQVDGSARRRYGGVGLGLALVKEIAETYSGYVTVQSEVGKGSTFTVFLPIAAGTDTIGDT